MTTPAALSADQLAQVVAQVSTAIGPPSIGEGFPNPVAQLFQAGNTTVITPAGLFIYSGTPALGNLILSATPASGTDAYGNVYTAGLDVTTGAISGTTFTGSDFIINSSGLFVYNGAPANGNLIASIAAAGGTDGFGNTYVGGLVSYDSATDYLQITGDFINLFKSGLFQGQQLLATGNATTQLSSGLQSNVDTAANVICESQLAQGTSSTINLSAAVTNALNAFTVGSTATFSGMVNIPAGDGPFISGEGFHTISLNTGITGTIRVKLLPWNAVWMDVQLVVSASGSITCGSLPSASYYPTQARNFPLAATVAGATAYIHMGTSGAIQFIGSSASGNPGGSFMYPTN